jgi:hypothetical protein
VSLPPLSARGFKAGESIAASVLLEEDLTVITVDGVEVDSVDSKCNLSSIYSPPPNLSEDEWGEYCQEWFEEVEVLAKRTADLKHIETLGLSENVFRTIVTDHLDYGSQRPLPKEVLDGYATVKAYFSKVIPLLRQQRIGLDVSDDIGEDPLYLLLRIRRIHFMMDSSVLGRRFCVRLTDGWLSFLIAVR